MSAAEKLRALDVQWNGHSVELWADAKYDLIRALPQIVAVVEAAEQSKRFLMDVLYDRRPEPGHEPTVEEARLLSAETVIASALAALDEALTVDGKTPK